MAKVEKPLHPVPDGMGEVQNLTNYLEDIRRKVNSQGDAVADTTDVSDTATQLNALLDELRDAGIIARS